MIEHGARIQVIDVEGWYDAGKIDTLLDTNRVMLEKGRARKPTDLDPSATIVEPVYIEDGVRAVNATIGPNVSIGAGTVIEGSTLRDTVVGANSTIARSALVNSLVGDDVVLDGVSGEVTIGDHSEVRVNAS